MKSTIISKGGIKYVPDHDYSQIEISIDAATLSVKPEQYIKLTAKNENDVVMELTVMAGDVFDDLANACTLIETIKILSK